MPPCLPENDPAGGHVAVAGSYTTIRVAIPSLARRSPRRSDRWRPGTRLARCGSPVATAARSSDRTAWLILGRRWLHLLLPPLRFSNLTVPYEVVSPTSASSRGSCSRPSASSSLLFRSSRTARSSACAFSASPHVPSIHHRQTPSDDGDPWTRMPHGPAADDGDPGTQRDTLVASNPTCATSAMSLAIIALPNELKSSATIKNAPTPPTTLLR
jgi:hypothetical protein